MKWRLGDFLLSWLICSLPFSEQFFPIESNITESKSNSCSDSIQDRFLAYILNSTFFYILFLQKNWTWFNTFYGEKGKNCNFSSWKKTQTSEHSIICPVQRRCVLWKARLCVKNLTFNFLREGYACYCWQSYLDMRSCDMLLQNVY